MSDTNENQHGPSSGFPSMTCSNSFDEAMFHLERMIHQRDDQHGQIDGYRADSLWLEEVRHHIRRLQRELDMARATANTFRQCAEITFGVMPFPRKFHWENEKSPSTGATEKLPK